MTGMMFDVFPFISGSLNRRKILKELPSHVVKGVNDEIKKCLNGEYISDEDRREILDNLEEDDFYLENYLCIFANYVGLTCANFSNCRRCEKITRLAVKNYIKQTGNKRYLALLKKKGENKR